MLNSHCLGIKVKSAPPSSLMVHQFMPYIRNVINWAMSVTAHVRNHRYDTHHICIHIWYKHVDKPLIHIK